MSMQNFRFIVNIVYLFLHGCGLHYSALSGLSVKRQIIRQYGSSYCVYRDGPGLASIIVYLRRS